MNKTNIEYLTHTWNPFVGCSGLDCAVRKNCWAYWQAKRAKHRCSLCYRFIPHVHFERFNQPSKVKKPSRIGTCFMSDFFDSNFDGCGVRSQVMIEMLKNPQHTFLVPTKQPQNIDLDERYPDNMWVMVSVNRKKDLWRIDSLRYVDCKIKVISFEPIYEDLGELNLDNIDWVIVGAQTRPEVQPKFSWLASIFDATAEHQIPLFTKNNLKLDRVVQQYPKQTKRGIKQ